MQADTMGLPQVLRQAKRWCQWRLSKQGVKTTKVPDQSTRDLAACRSFEEVCDLPRGSERGIGLVVTGGIEEKGAHLVVLDVDACRDRETGDITEWAKQLLTLLPGYAEISPSGSGLRVMFLSRQRPNVRPRITGPWPAANNTAKRPEVQVFGLGPAGYVTITGDRLPDSPLELPVFSSVNHAFGSGFLEPAEEHEAVKMLPREESVSLEQITERVLAAPRGQALIDAQWKTVAPDKSASDVYHVLVRLAVAASEWDIETATIWLLTCTAWGRGEVDDSADPDKYMRERWVKADVERAARKERSPVSEFEAMPAPPAARTKAKRGDPLAVFDAWQDDGPLVHMPTGIPTLDDLTGGGLVLGSRVYLVGAPDAGKTALAVQLADTYLRQGIPCGFLGIDEEPVDLVTRFLQRRGITRHECEQRSAATMARGRAEMSMLPLRIYDAGSSIEEAAVDLHRFALAGDKSGDPRPACVLFVDSVQTARISGEDADDSIYRAVTRRVAALRAAATRYRMLVIATSEMNRGAYRSKKVEDQTSDMASAKESGAIEFSARVMLTLKSVPGSSDVIELRVAKNKHGLTHRVDQEGIFLRVDRAAQQLTEESGFAPVDPAAARRHEQTIVDAGALAALLLLEDMGQNAVLAELDISRRRMEVARDWLMQQGALVEVNGTGRRKVMSLRAGKLPPEAQAEMQRAMTRPKENPRRAVPL